MEWICIWNSHNVEKYNCQSLIIDSYNTGLSPTSLFHKKDQRLLKELIYSSTEEGSEQHYQILQTVLIPIVNLISNSSRIL